MKSYAIRIMLAASLALLSAAVAGCTAAPPDASLSAEENQPIGPIADHPAGEPEQKPDRPSKEETNGLEISSNQQQDEPDQAGGDEATPPPEPEASDEQQPADAPPSDSKPLEQFTAAQPRLMGMTVGDSQEAAAQLHGQPKEINTMKDGERELSVHQYDGFMVGMNAQQKIEFITVMSRHVEPGLNGLHIGSTAADAVELLGEPASENEYVLTYQGNDTMLKLDIDPLTNEILSARLFPEEE